MRAVLSVVALIVCVAAAPSAQQKPATPKAEPAAARAAGAAINLNTASAAELEQLPGIGAKVAARIVDYRAKNGPFRKIEELMNVQGIGEKSFLKLRPQLTVGSGATSSQQH